jgi:hypothetical protein
MKNTLISLAAAATLAVSALAITPAAAAPAFGIGVKAPAGNVELARHRHHSRHKHFVGPYAFYRGGGYSDCFWTRRGYVCWY